MEDAYVIGIRLVLENGVSAGIATIAGELAALDAAIAATTVDLARLQSLARSLDLPRPGMPQPPRPAPPPASEQPGADPILAPRPAAAEPSPSTPKPASGGAENAAPPPPGTPPAASPSSAATSAPPPVIRVLTPTISATPPLVQAPLVPPPVPPAATAPPAVARTPRESTSGPSGAPVPAPPAPPEINIFVPPSPATSSAAPSERSTAHAPRLTGPSQDRQMPTSSIAPVAPPQSTPAPPRPAAPAYPGASVAPPARENNTAPRQGDVYLDGTRLGRWMADRLAGDVGGPRTGVSGFDPRLSPTWPGAAQGF